jgi:anti-sigma factor RsiW
MTECWKDGDLRAYADRELAPSEMHNLTAHLETCAGCETRYRELSRRAQKVGALLAELRAPAPVISGATPHHAARPVRTWPRWAAALTAAAGLALILMNPTARPVPPGTAGVSRQFVALDDEPIETGMVVRVAVGPDQVQADVIIGPDGRARAFRLIAVPSSN